MAKLRSIAEDRCSNRATGTKTPWDLVDPERFLDIEVGLALTGDRKADLSGNVSVAKSFQGCRHLVPWQVADALRIEFAGGDQPDKVGEVAAEGITSKEQLETLEADRRIEVDVAYVERGALVRAVAEHHERALRVDHRDETAKRVATHRFQYEVEAAPELRDVKHNVVRPDGSSRRPGEPLATCPSGRRRRASARTATARV